MSSPVPDVPIAAVDVATLGISTGGQPYVVTLAGLLGAGGFVDDNGRPDIDRLRASLAPRIEAEADLHSCPERRDGQWWWTRAPADLTAHITVEKALPSESFEDVCGRLVMAPLEASRPPWHIALVPAARPGRCGIVVRLHHALVDGARASALMERLFGSERGVSEHEKSGAGAARVAEREQSSRPSFGARLGFRVRSLRRSRISSRALLGPVGAARAVSSASVDLAALEAAAQRGGATVNDAYLVAVGQGLRIVLERAGEPIPESLAVSVPVRIDAVDAAHNAVGVMIVDVPLAEPRSALAVVARRTAASKPLARASGTVIRSALLARGFNVFARHQRMIATVASNVRGPRHPLALDGAPLVELWPLGPLAGNVRVGFTAVSYCGRLSIGIETDSGHLPFAAEIAVAVEATLAAIAGD
ncbi:wax ester/triacylglycerol synthase domain-containing protein [Nocardia sp. 348MFTsu5.1]|uniref:wax ester/triacylglycerol synthase domain-containing protein n=1 Tax=Nocardia sp. 348MFTsu5.1 TaxID=1172185 RepID=UPI00035F789E|nr:wax ester/triacylglycerol synthase domain-containing protein [Nocardia sp. 348MFTsu5.1]